MFSAKNDGPGQRETRAPLQMFKPTVVEKVVRPQMSRIRMAARSTRAYANLEVDSNDGGGMTGEGGGGGGDSGMPNEDALSVEAELREMAEVDTVISQIMLDASQDLDADDDMMMVDLRADGGGGRRRRGGGSGSVLGGSNSFLATIPGGARRTAAAAASAAAAAAAGRGRRGRGGLYQLTSNTPRTAMVVWVATMALLVVGLTLITLATAGLKGEAEDAGGAGGGGGAVGAGPRRISTDGRDDNEAIVSPTSSSMPISLPSPSVLPSPMASTGEGGVDGDGNVDGGGEGGADGGNRESIDGGGMAEGGNERGGLDDPCASACTDITLEDGEAWYDMIGKGCSSYSTDYCKLYGWELNYGLSASTVCCSCGGGHRPDGCELPLPSPATLPPPPQSTSSLPQLQPPSISPLPPPPPSLSRPSTTPSQLTELSSSSSLPVQHPSRPAALLPSPSPLSLADTAVEAASSPTDVPARPPPRGRPHPSASPAAAVTSGWGDGGGEAGQAEAATAESVLVIDIEDMQTPSGEGGGGLVLLPDAAHWPIVAAGVEIQDGGDGAGTEWRGLSYRYGRARDGADQLTVDLTMLKRKAASYRIDAWVPAGSFNDPRVPFCLHSSLGRGANSWYDVPEASREYEGWCRIVSEKVGETSNWIQVGEWQVTDAHVATAVSDGADKAHLTVTVHANGTRSMVVVDAFRVTTIEAQAPTISASPSTTMIPSLSSTLTLSLSSSPSKSVSSSSSPSSSLLPPSPSSSSAISPSSSASSSLPCPCVDLTLADGSAWHDAYDATYNCQQYAADQPLCNDLDENLRFEGFIAREACCICGGGRCREVGADGIAVGREDGEIAGDGAAYVDGETSPSNLPLSPPSPSLLLLPSASAQLSSASPPPPSQSPSCEATCKDMSLPTGLPWSDGYWTCKDFRLAVETADPPDACNLYGNVDLPADIPPVNIACCICGGGEHVSCLDGNEGHGDRSEGNGESHAAGNNGGNTGAVSTMPSSSQSPLPSNIPPSPSPSQQLPHQMSPSQPCEATCEDETATGGFQWQDPGGWRCQDYSEAKRLANLGHQEYPSDPCAEFGHEPDSNGVAANKACCFCGGGVRSSDSCAGDGGAFGPHGHVSGGEGQSDATVMGLSSLPSVPPSPSPPCKPKCTDKQIKINGTLVQWRDPYEMTCAGYAEQLHVWQQQQSQPQLEAQKVDNPCTTYANPSDRTPMTMYWGKEACCVCGGGNIAVESCHPA